MMAAAAIAPSSALITRSSSSSSSSSSSYTRRFLSSFSITKPILRPSLYLSHPLQPFPVVRITSIRRPVNHAGSEYKRPPGWDYKHWLIYMDEDDVDVFVQTLARVLGSEEEAKKKIYKISSWPFGFGCEIDEETSNRLEGLPGVLSVSPDKYEDPENKDYGGELYVNGEIVQRSPERQMRLRNR